jgi:hypothetical protein
MRFQPLHIPVRGKLFRSRVRRAVEEDRDREWRDFLIAFNLDLCAHESWPARGEQSSSDFPAQQFDQIHRVLDPLSR